MSHKSQLSYIMDLLDIVGTDLATTLSLDRTLISKWKNNVRPLQASNKHFSSLVEALIFFNSKNKTASLERFFGQVYPNEDKNEPEYLEVCLTIWLEGHDNGNFSALNHWKTAENALYASKIDIYQGNAGKRHGLLAFFEYASTLPGGQEIFISDVEGYLWRDEDPEFSQRYHKLFSTLADQGHNITIILPEDSVISEPSRMAIKRLESYFSGHITSYSLKTKCNNPMQSLYLIHRHMALVSVCATPDPSSRYISVYKDPFSVKHYVSLFIERIKEAKPLLSNYAIQGKALDNLLNAYDKKNMKANIILSSPELPLYMIPHDELLNILNAHVKSSTDKKKIETIYQKKKAILLGNLQDQEMDILLSRRAFEQMVSSELVRHDALSELCEEDIFLTPQLIHRALCRWTDYTDQHPHIHVSMIDFENIGLLENMKLYVFEDKMIIATQLKNRDYFITSESDIVLDQVQDKLRDILMAQEEDSTLEHFCQKFSD